MRNLPKIIAGVTLLAGCCRRARHAELRATGAADTVATVEQA